MGADPTTPNGHQPDLDRAYTLRALRGDITSDNAYHTVAITRYMADNGGLADTELVEALEIGDLGHGDDPARFVPFVATWENHETDIDPATTAAFDRRVAANEPEPIGYDTPKWAALIVDGKTWLTSGPDHPEALWGNDTTILAAKGQPTTIAGPQGAGKSVFGQRLALGWLGITDQILDIPIIPGPGNVLYLASDRPEQARLSMRRMVTEDDHNVLEARMRVWKGPPPEDVAKQPLMLLHMAEVAEAGCIIIDSAKDVALKLSADEVGAAYNSALQHCVAHDIEIIALHHPRKLSGETRDNPVRVLDDLYGAYWITAGNGSVIYLQPEEFDTWTLTQLKSPNGTKAEIPYEHAINTGDLRPPTNNNLVGILTEAGYDGCSATHIACCLYRVDKPTETQAKKVRKALNDLAEEGIVVKVGATRNTKWRLAE